MLAFGNYQVRRKEASRLSPHPGPLPWGEGETDPASFQISTSGFAKNAGEKYSASKLFPLPEGEGQGEGERVIHSKHTVSTSTFTANLPEQSAILTAAAWHSLAWLVCANAVGLLLATLLLFPEANHWLGEITYGRWVPLHLNLQLYGWCSLPLVAWLLKTYRVHREPASRWARTALWMWSASLFVGAVSWLAGHSSGKLFLDWTGYPRILFPLAICFLWGVLAWSLRQHWQSEKNRVAKITGLVGLLTVPPTLYWAASPHVYPAINPGTGGPTGASLLDSTLGIVIILLLLPLGLERRQKTKPWINKLVLGLYGAELIIYFFMGHHNSSNHSPSQFLGLGSLLPWMVAMPAYYQLFDWPRHSRRWLKSFMFWWMILLASGWFAFLPGVLDHLKFTDGLVAHSHLAMAGFVSSMNLFLLTNFLEEDGEALNRKWAFHAWQTGLAIYIVSMAIAGWIEGSHPSFTIIPGFTRNLLYSVRLVGGLLMFSASVNWLMGVSRVLRGKSWWDWSRCDQSRRRAQRQATDNSTSLSPSTPQVPAMRADMVAAQPCPPDLETSHHTSILFSK